MLVNAMQSLQVPADLLRKAYLVGRTPFRVCVADPRVSYSLYVPQQYVDAHAALQKDSTAISLNLIVAVHGTRRDVGLARDGLVSLADKLGIAILAPLFPAGMDGALDLSSFKVLNAKTYRADLILLSILDEVSQIWPALDTAKVALTGFSGGAQFVHRMFYLHPERVTAVAIGAPGSVTLLEDQPWPAGISNVKSIFARSIDIKKLQAARVLVYIGQDDKAHPLADDRLQALAKASDMQQRTAEPVDRITKALRLHQDLLKHGVPVGIKLVPSVGHDYAAMLPMLLCWLEDAMTPTAA